MSLHYGSLTRIADLEGAQQLPLPRADWEWGDYVIGEVVETPRPDQGVELRNGRMATIDVGDRWVGAFGVRMTTLEATGSWEDIGEDLRFDHAGITVAAADGGKKSSSAAAAWARACSCARSGPPWRRTARPGSS